MPVQMGLTFTHTNPWRNKKHEQKIEMDIGTIGIEANKIAATFMSRKWIFHFEYNKKMYKMCIFTQTLSFYGYK